MTVADRFVKMVSDEMATQYGLTFDHAKKLVDKSPLRSILLNDPEYVTHMPIQTWTKLIYENQNA